MTFFLAWMALCVIDSMFDAIGGRFMTCPHCHRQKDKNDDE